MTYAKLQIMHLKNVNCKMANYVSPLNCADSAVHLLTGPVDSGMLNRKPRQSLRADSILETHRGQVFLNACAASNVWLLLWVLQLVSGAEAGHFHTGNMNSSRTKETAHSQ
jgi:hypothetical protein